MIIIREMSHDRQEAPKPDEEMREPAAPPKRIASRELLGSGNELIIEHGAREYRLRITNNGKLILTA